MHYAKMVYKAHEYYTLEKIFTVKMEIYQSYFAVRPQADGKNHIIKYFRVR